MYIAKDPKEIILKAPQPTSETRDDQGEIFGNYHHKKKGKTVCACICEAHELTRKRIPETQREDHVDDIAVRRDATAAADKECEKLNQEFKANKR